MKIDLATQYGVIRRYVLDIPELMQFFDTFMISALLHFGGPHDFFTRDINRAFEAIQVPALEQRHVHSYMQVGNPVIPGNGCIKAS